jgi:hypothetical protein
VSFTGAELDAMKKVEYGILWSDPQRAFNDPGTPVGR